MQDDPFIAPPPPRRRGFGRMLLAVLLLVLLVIALGLAWLGWQGKLASILPRSLGGGKTDQALIMADATAPAVPQAPDAPAAPQPAASAPAAPSLASLGSVETRLALLEERLSRLDLQAEAASGNAARAEGLLIAFATRRALDRGVPLGYLEDQLKLRFGNAQPNAVDTVIAAARQPVTLDELATGLDASAGQLAQTETGNAWNTLTREFSELFTVRRDSRHGLSPEQRLDRAQLLLASGKTEQAITLVSQMPGAGKADKWLADARRYAEARRALDLIETAAMLEPRTLQDGAGRKVVQPSPLAAPPPGQ